MRCVMCVVFLTLANANMLRLTYTVVVQGAMYLYKMKGKSCWMVGALKGDQCMPQMINSYT